MYSSYLHVVSFLSTPQKLKVRIESNYKFNKMVWLFYINIKVQLDFSLGYI